MQEREITSRIRIDQLQPLLETTIDRVTAPMPAVTLEELLQPEPAPPPAISVTFRHTPHGTAVPEYVELEIEHASRALGTVNGIPVHAGTRRESAIDDAIDAAVDAAIETEIHIAEIEAAIDAVTLRAPITPPQPRYMAVAVGLAAAFVMGIGLMFAL